MVEAQDPHGMVPTSTPYIYKVFETIHMLWMGGWVHHYAITTILVSPKFRELADFLGHSEAINDARVDWLMPKTHMEWFSHPLHTYTSTRCLRPFIVCYGWADGSTIMPLPPYMYAQNLGVVVSILAIAIVVVTLILPLDLIIETIVVIVFGFVYRARVPPTP
jgi:hypothetical protein